LKRDDEEANTIVGFIGTVSFCEKCLISILDAASCLNFSSDFIHFVPVIGIIYGSTLYISTYLYTEHDLKVQINLLMKEINLLKNKHAVSEVQYIQVLI
jgi:hypothetical protein